MFGFGHREVQDRFSMNALGRPYRFVPPRTGLLFPRILKKILPWYMRQKYGITQWEVRGVEWLRTSIDAGHGVILTPNHSRDSDSVGIGFVGHASETCPHFMAGWHVILESWFQSFVIPRVGGFSVLREGSDRQSVRTAIELAATGSRPVIIFPEGHVTRTNDRLATLQEGASLIARQAMGQREKAGAGPLVIHPVAIKYQFTGDFEKAARPKLQRLEGKLNLPDVASLGLLQRLERVQEAIIRDREIDKLGKLQEGSIEERAQNLADHLLTPLEEAWDRQGEAADIYERVRRLRTAILDSAIERDAIEEENRRLRRQLEDCTWALKLASYSSGYLAENPSVERYLETLDAMVEDVFNSIKTDSGWRMVLDIGRALPVERRDKSLGESTRAALENQLLSLAEELNQSLP